MDKATKGYEIKVFHYAVLKIFKQYKSLFPTAEVGIYDFMCLLNTQGNIKWKFSYPWCKI
jgi:hypothetical protein